MPRKLPSGSGTPAKLVAADAPAVAQASSGDPYSVRIGGPIKANNGMLLAEMAAAGSGIVYGPCFILQPMIERGQLVRLLPDWATRRLPIHAVYPTRRHLSARVQAMTCFLSEWFARLQADAP